MNEKEPTAPATSLNMERKLAAILSADVKGYSRLMGEDDEATVRTLTSRRVLMTTLIQQHRGRVVDSPGDNLLAEFASVVDAVRCAVELQNELKTQNAELPLSRQMAFRMGINLGDVLTEGGRLYGDGVNIAARLEGLAEAGGICLSGIAYDQVKNKLPFSYEYLGEREVKNIAEPVRVWRIRIEESSSQEPSSQQSKVEEPEPHKVRSARRWVVAGLLFITTTIITVHYFSLPTPSTQPLAPSTQPSLRTTAAPAALPLPDKPSIIVLPFDNMSKDPEQEYFSDGITEDITSDLSKIANLFVISRNSAFTYKGKAVKVQDVSKEMGVRYVLEGSVRKADNQVRITAQLIDATTGEHLWAERYDRPLQDIFALQDEIRQKIVFALKVKLTPEEQERFRRAPTNNLEAYDHWLRGQESLLRAYSEAKKEANTQARQMYGKAIELDPQYAGAYAGLAQAYWSDWSYQWSAAHAQSLDQAFVMAQRAVALNDSLSLPHRVLGLVSVWKKLHAQAVTEAERAIALNPNDDSNYNALANILIFAGQPEEAVRLSEKAIRLNPRSPSLYLLTLAAAHRMAGRYDEALTLGKKVLALTPHFAFAHINQVICYAELGRLEEARAEVAEVLRLRPNWSVALVSRSPYKNPADLERILAALRKAGLK